MKNKKVKKMMVDVERHYSGDIHPSWIAWIDGICLIAGANFLWLNHKHIVSISANQLKRK